CAEESSSRRHLQLPETRSQCAQCAKNRKPPERLVSFILCQKRLCQHDDPTGDRENHLGENTKHLRIIVHRFSATLLVRVTLAWATLCARPVTAPSIARIQ